MNNFSFKPFGLGLSTDKDMYFDLTKTSPTLSTITSEASSESDNNEDVNKRQKQKRVTEDDKKQKNLYKTELCRNWEETNHCRYGTKCQYAHGAADLRVVERHPKYKTQKCRTFHQTGSCPYGSRCTFRHFNLPGDDIKFNQEKQELGCPMQSVKHETKMVCPVQSAKVSTTWSFDEDSLLPSNAESLLPHQLLSDLESPDEEPIRRCPLRNYINLPNFSQAPHYLPANHPSTSSSSEDCKPLFHPWLF